MEKFKLGRFLLFGLLAVATVFSPAVSDARFSLYEDNGLDVGLTVKVAAGLFATENTNFGAGRRFDATDQNGSWGETYIEPILDISYDTGSFGSFYAMGSYIATQTIGDGDPAGFSNENSDRVNSEQAHVGWKSGDLFETKDLLDISWGAQDFQIGDGFLIANGGVDGQGNGAFWLGPRKSFQRAGIVSINTNPVRADLFYLDTDNQFSNRDMAGANVEYTKEMGTVAATYIKVMNCDEGYYGNSEGINVYSVRANGRPFADMGFEELFLTGEYVYENGGGRDDVSAIGYYAEAGWTFSNLPWTPTLSYRYAFFSGDEDPNDGKSEDFEHLNYGFTRGWGTYFMGEFVGEYLLFNQNEIVNMIHLSAKPTSSVTIGALYYDFKLDEEIMYGTDVKSDKFAQEVNFYVDYAVNANLWLSGVLAYATPDEAAKNYVGGFSEDTTLFEIYMVYTF